MEAAVVNLFSSGDSVLVINCGKFGERWTKLSKKFGLNVVELKSQPGEVISSQDLESTLQKNSSTPFKAILFQASETSTGVKLPTQEICEIAKKYGALSVCDAITACGVFELPMDSWGIDVLITGSQKALMLPPGLAMISLSEKAWQAQSNATLPRFYFDLALEKKAQSKNQTSWTPAISLIQGLKQTLDMLKEEGLENVFARHRMLASATRAGVKALGLELLSKVPSEAVTAVLVPPSIEDGKQIPKRMQSDWNVTISGGQDELDGKIFRLSHFGYCDSFDVTTGLSALELTLSSLGHSVRFGEAVGAALQVFATGRKK